MVFYFNKSKYEAFWSIEDLVKIITEKNNYQLIKQKLSSEQNLINFLSNTKKCITNKFCEDFYFYAKPGDIVIFNETGIHKGSNPSKNK